MTPDLLTRLITDLRGLVATMLPAIDLLQTDLAGAALHGTQPRLQLFCNENSQAGNEGRDVLARGAAPASLHRQEYAS